LNYFTGETFKFLSDKTMCTLGIKDETNRDRTQIDTEPVIIKAKTLYAMYRVSESDRYSPERVDLLQF
jgi:hypothetical protein